MISSNNVRWIQPAAGPVRAVIPVPGSKSITNRLLLLAALARGSSRISGILHSDDTDVFAQALSSLGFRLRFSDDGDECLIEGSGGRIPTQRARVGAAAPAPPPVSLPPRPPPDTAVTSSTPPPRCAAVP